MHVFYRKHNKNPTIIFDMNAFGCKHPLLLWQFEIFFNRLKTIGANLVFFSDGHIQNEKLKCWCKKEDDNYEDVCKILSQNNNNIKRNSTIFKCLILLQSVIRVIKHKNFGEVYISTEVE